MAGRLYPILSRDDVLILSGIAALILLALLATVGTPSGGDAGQVFALQLAFTEENFQAVLERWGRAGTAQFLGTLWLDYLFPIAYAVFLASLAARLAAAGQRAPHAPPRLLIALPWGAAALDYAENTLHLAMLGQGGVSAPLVLAASLAAAAKWALIAATVLGLARRALARFLRHQRP